MAGQSGPLTSARRLLLSGIISTGPLQRQAWPSQSSSCKTELVVRRSGGRDTRACKGVSIWEVGGLSRHRSCEKVCVCVCVCARTSAFAVFGQLQICALMMDRMKSMLPSMSLHKYS